MSLVLMTLKEKPRPAVIFALLIPDEASQKTEMCRNVEKLLRASQ
jgi:hypothetical protein